MNSLKQLPYQNSGIWNPQDGIRYLWRTWDGQLAVITSVASYGRSLHIRDKDGAAMLIVNDEVCLESRIETEADSTVSYDAAKVYTVNRIRLDGYRGVFY